MLFHQTLSTARARTYQACNSRHSAKIGNVGEHPGAESFVENTSYMVLVSVAGFLRCSIIFKGFQSHLSVHVLSVLPAVVVALSVANSVDKVFMFIY